MPFVSKIEARAFARATEVSERVAIAIMSVFSEQLRQHVSITMSNAKGQAGDAIGIISATLEGKENCDGVLNRVLEQMDMQSLRALERSLDKRLDDQCIFFLRIDKQAAFLGKMKLADDADVVSARFHFKQYPHCERDDVMLVIESSLRACGESV